MAGFCTKCGRPLPESGVCACSAQQPNPQYNPAQQQQPYQQPYQQQPYQQPYQAPYGQPYQQPYRAPRNPNGFGAALAKLPSMIGDYCKDAIGTTRRLSQAANPNNGLVFMLLAFVLTALGTLLLGLVHFSDRVDDFVVRWLLTSLFAPVVAYGIGIGLIYALTAMSKIKADFRSVISVVGVSSVLPCLLLAVSSLISLADDEGKVFLAFALLIVAAWLASLLVAALRTYEIKLNIGGILLIMLVVYLGILVMRTFWLWYMGADFELYLYMYGF